MLSLKKYIAAGLLIFAAQAQADVFFGIQYMDTWQEVKARYPNADYEELKLAWVGSDERFIRLSGPGLSRNFAILFKKIPGFGPIDNPDPFVVESVHIAYAGQVKFSEFKKKYGNPSGCELNENFKKVCRYEKNNFSIFLNEDNSAVNLLSSHFTKEERLARFRAKLIESAKRQQPPPIEAPAAAPAPPDPLDAYATSPAKN